VRYFILVLTLVFLNGCGDSWKGWIYTDKTDLTHSISIGEFNTLEECRKSARDELSDHNALYSGDYECGLNCKYNSAMDINVCEDTVK